LFPDPDFSEKSGIFKIFKVGVGVGVLDFVGVGERSFLKVGVGVGVFGLKKSGSYVGGDFFWPISFAKMCLFFNFSISVLEHYFFNIYFLPILTVFKQKKISRKVKNSIKNFKKNYEKSLSSLLVSFDLFLAIRI